MAGKFTRPPELEAEWQALGSPEDDSFWERLDAARVETVVAARRHHQGAPFCDRIDEVLVAKLEPLVRSAVRGVARNEASLYREEIEETVVEAVWREILTAEDTFYEIRCAKKLRMAALDAWRKVVGGKARRLERHAVRIQAREEDDTSSGPSVAEGEIPDPGDGYAQAEENLDWFTALAPMPPEVATAIDLHYRADLKIHSNNPSEPTVSRLLGCSERKGRELIARGEELFRGQAKRLQPKEAP